MPKVHERPYWHGYHEGEGTYFGYWCVEAVAVVKAFGIDDTACLGLRNYPGDLLRPNGPTTHLASNEGEAAASVEPSAEGLGRRLRGLVSGTLRRK